MTEEDAQNVQAIRGLVADGRLPEAALLCEQHLCATSTTPTASILRAQLFTTRGEMSEAIAQYEEALALAPDALTAYLGIANILAGKGWLSSAVLVMENARQSATFTAEAQMLFDSLQTRLADAQRSVRNPPQ